MLYASAEILLIQINSFHPSKPHEKDGSSISILQMRKQMY